MAGLVNQFVADYASVTSILFTAIATLAVGLRLYTRIKLVKLVSACDITICVSWLLSVLLTISVCLEVNYGMGRTITDVSKPNLMAMLKLFWASIFLYNPALSTVKMSILLQYIRVFASSPIRNVCKGVLVCVSLHGITCFILSIWACIPVSFFWNKSIPNGKCIDLLAMWFFNASFNIVTDLVIIALPIPVLRQLHMPRKQKFTLFCVFFLGGFGCLTSILRLHSLYIVTSSPDITRNNNGAATWSCVEVGVFITCACLATLRPLITKLFPKIYDPTAAGTVGTAATSRYGNRGSTTLVDSPMSPIDHPAGPLAWALDCERRRAACAKLDEAAEDGNGERERTESGNQLMLYHSYIRHDNKITAGESYDCSPE